MIIKNILNFTKKEILCLLNQKYERMCTMSITANIMSVIQENKKKGTQPGLVIQERNVSNKKGR